MAELAATTVTPHKVLVTGATGFIGVPLLRLLVECGFQVYAAVRTMPTAPVAQVHYKLCGQISSHTDWSPILKGIDAVVHLVGLAHVTKRTEQTRQQNFFQTNVVASAHFMRHAISCAVKRVVYISSIKVNGECSSGRRPFRAEDDPAPEDDYARSKLEAETQLFAQAQHSNVELVVIRPPLVYGPNPKGNFAALLKAVRWNVPLPLAAVHNQRSLVSVFNLCDCIVKCLRHPRAAGEVFLVCDGQDVSTAELISMLAQALGKRARLWRLPPKLLTALAQLVGGRAALQRLCGDLQVDIDKTKRLLEWQPPYTIEESLALSVRETQN